MKLNKINTIYFLVEIDFFDYKKRYNIDFFKRKGFKIKSLNASPITYKKFFSFYKKKIKKNEIVVNNKNLDKIFSKIKQNEFIISLLKPNWVNKIIFEKLEDYKVNYSILDINQIPLPKQEFFSVIKKIFFNPIKSFAIILKLMRNINVDINPKMIFYSGEKCFVKWQNKQSTSKLVSIPSSDYDNVIKLKDKSEKKAKYNKPYAVFISGGHDLSDLRFFTQYITPQIRPTYQEYYSPLIKFFSEFKKYSGMEIKFALHPKSKHRNIFSKIGREYSGKTLELVKDSSFVITQASTAISYAILFNKPLMFITNDKFTISSKESIIANAAFFKKKPFNTSVENINYERILMEKKIDNNLYQKYKREFLSYKKSIKTSYQIILNEINKLKIDANS